MTRVVEAKLRISAENKTGAGLKEASAELDRFRKRQREMDRRALRLKNQEDRLARRATANERAVQMIAVQRAEARIERRAETTRRVAALATRAQGASPAGAEGMALGGVGARVLAPAALAMGATASIQAYAGIERAIGRIGITAGATAEETAKAFSAIEQAAYNYAMPQAEIVAGLETLVAAGMSLEEALSFLPSVAATAQASGAAVTDIAATADAVARNFKIAGDEAQFAFDIMVTGGKSGMFELRDMAQYLPSLAPAFAALGYEGEEGLKKLVANLQVLRVGTGSASEAATNLSNVLAKIESEETANKFEDFGVDLRAEMARARREGRDLLEFFVELTDETVNGDLSKLPLLFGDMQMAAGMRTLMTNTELLTEVMGALGNAAGATGRDLDQVLSDTQTKLDRMATSWEALLKNIGEGVSTVANPTMEWLNSEADEYRNVQAAIAKEEAAGGSEAEAREEYNRRYEQDDPEPSKLNPLAWTAWSRRRRSSFVEDAEAYGRGDIPTWHSNIEARRRARQPALTATQAYALSDVGGLGGRNIDDRDTLRTGIPLPMGRESSGAYPAEAMSVAEQYREYGRGRRAAEERSRGVDTTIRHSASLIEDTQARIAAAVGPIPVEVVNAAGPSVGLFGSTDPSAGLSPPIGAFDTSGAPSLVDVTAEADALRLAMEGGAGAISIAGTDAGASMTAAVQTMVELLRSAILSAGSAIASEHGEAIRRALSQPVNVRVNAPNSGPLANRAFARTMADAGTPRGGGVNADLGQSMPNAGTPRGG